MKEVKIEFCRIGGYESLREGTKKDTCKSLQDVVNVLNRFDIEYDISINDPVKLAKSVEDCWEYCWNDGGGSGWIEY